MGDPRTMPPLSGEIMTDAGPRAQARKQAATDVVDAEFVSIARGGGERVVEPPSPRAPPSPVPTGLNVLVASAPGGSRRGGIGFWTTGIAAAIAAFWMSGGHTISQWMPSLRGAAEPIRIAELTSRVADTATGPRLFIDGEVRNVAGTRMASPDLTIDVTATDGIVTRYRLATGSGPMYNGEARRFSSRLAAPEAGVRSVAVAIDRKGED